jgi:4-hydroxybenzoate polyprenyltransferase
MRNPIVIVGLGIVALAGFSLFAGWAFFAAQHMGQGWGEGWRGLAPIWPYVAGGAVIVTAMTAFFMWLAFYSANNRYEDRAGRDEP